MRIAIIIALIFITATGTVRAQTSTWTPWPTYTPTASWTPVPWPTLTDIPSTMLTPKPWPTPTPPPLGVPYYPPNNPTFIDDGTTAPGFFAISDLNIARLMVFFAETIVSFWLYLTINFRNAMQVFKLVLFFIILGYLYQNAVKLFQKVEE